MTIRRSRTPTRHRLTTTKRKRRNAPITEGIKRLLSKPGRFGVSFPPLNQTVSGDYLKPLSFHIQNFFGVERQQDAAHFLFLTWMNCFGRAFDYDLAKGLEQFQRDVDAEITPKRRRGRPPSDDVAFARQRRKDEDEPTYRQICKEWYAKQGKLDWWNSLKPKQQQDLIDKLMSACGKKKPRKEKDPEKL